MPVYEYACKACGHEFEREQRISDKPLKKCPSCGSMQAKRLISRTSFVLKGGGWYNDLYASSSGNKDKGDAKAEGGDGADAASKSESKSDKKGGDGSGKGKGKGKSKGPKGSKAA